MGDAGVDSAGKELGGLGQDIFGVQALAVLLLSALSSLEPDVPPLLSADRDLVAAE